MQPSESQNIEILCFEEGKGAENGGKKEGY